jgi:hypothetical protein
MLASVSSISGIPILGRLPSWSALKFVTCFLVSHSIAHTRGREANFTCTTFAKRVSADGPYIASALMAQKTSLPTVIPLLRVIQPLPINSSFSGLTSSCFEQICHIILSED